MRSAAMVRMAAPTHNAATGTRLRLTPSADVKTNTTPAGTMASARPYARNANESANQAHTPSAVVAAIAKLPSLGTGETARGNWRQTRRMLIRNWSIVSLVGKPNLVGSRKEISPISTAIATRPVGRASHALTLSTRSRYITACTPKHTTNIGRRYAQSGNTRHRLTAVTKVRNVSAMVAGT